MLPVVHHPAYRVAMPQGHRFPMGKYGRLMAYLLESAVVVPAQVRRPELASAVALEHAHTPTYVDAVLSQTLEPAALVNDSSWAQRERH